MSSPQAPGRLPWSWTALAVLPGLLLAAYYEHQARLVAGAGFPLDDAWIHAQFARNLATGHGFSYTGGRWVAGSTAPAWTMLLAVGYALVPNIVTVAKVLGLVLQAATGAAAARFAGWLTGSRLAAFTAGVVVTATPILVWGAVSGMEVPLTAFLVITGLSWHLRARDSGSPWQGLGSAALLALACLSRPECLTILAIALADTALRSGAFASGSWRTRLRPIAGALLIAGVVLGLWVALNWTTIGRPLPTTFYVKSGSGLMRALEIGDGEMARRVLTVHGPNALTNFGLIVRDQLGLAAWLLPIGLVACAVTPRRRAAAVVLLLVLIVAPFSMGLIAPQRLKLSNERYAPHLIALAALMVAAAAAPLGRLVTGRALAPIAWLVPIALGVSVGWQTQAGAFWFARSVKNIQELHVRLGEWIRWHIPQGTVVATNDVGAIAYFGRHEILDLEGLVSPEALAYRGVGRGLQVVEAFRPDYVAIFPHWYPEIAAQPDRFRLVHRASIPDNYVSAGGEFLVLQAPWARVPLLPPPAEAISAAPDPAPPPPPADRPADTARR